MNREQFIEERRSGLGGSDIGAILGLSRYKTPVQVWLEKTGRADDQESSLQMRFGSFAEDFVASEYEKRTGCQVEKYAPMLRHPTAPLIGHVDRLVVPDGVNVLSCRSEIRTDTGLECKTASAYEVSSPDWGEEGTDQVPPAYLVQCAAYMALTGCPRWDLAVLFGNQEFRIYRLLRDRELEDEIIARASEWWNRHVIQGNIPDPSTIEDVRALYKGVTDQTIVADERLLAWAKVAEEAADRAKQYETLAESAKAHLLSAMGEASVLKLDGNKCFRRRLVTRKSYTVPESQYVMATFSNLRN